MPQKVFHRSASSTRSRQRQLVLLDTGPIVGLYNENDELHSNCVTFFGQIENFNFLITHAVLCEVVFHLQKGRKPEAAANAVIDFLEKIESRKILLHEFDEKYIGRLKALRSKYKDTRLNIADLSLVLAAEDRQIGNIVTIDRRDFSFLTFTKHGKSTKPGKVAFFTIISP